MENLTGRWLAGRYNLQQFLGRGSIGDVYKAWDRTRAAHLSLKLLPLDLAEDKLFLNNFQREAQTLIRLQHTYIVGFYGLEQADGLAFLLMDYIDGSNLGLEIPRVKTAFSMPQALYILRPVCAALHYAHQMGVVHGDLKPANILIHRKGTVLVTDFGIMRLVETATASSRRIPGTPAYKAPELIQGHSPTAQSDIYALGIVLYEMLSGGKRPFEGDQAKIGGSVEERICWEQINLAPPPLRRINPAVPQHVESAVMHCLEKHPEQRFDRPMELLDVLEGSSPMTASAKPLVLEKPTPQPASPTPSVTAKPVQSTGSLRPPAPERPAQSTGNLRPPAPERPVQPTSIQSPPVPERPLSPPISSPPIAPVRPAAPPGGLKASGTRATCAATGKRSATRCQPACRSSSKHTTTDPQSVRAICSQRQPPWS